MAGVPKSIDDYLAALTPKQRTALQKLRRAIHAAAPGAVECICYRLPAFRLDGKVVAAMSARANHCAYYPMSSETVKTLAKELARYDTSSGTIRFPPERPLPAALVRKLVKARIREDAG